MIMQLNVILHSYAAFSCLLMNICISKYVHRNAKVLNQHWIRIPIWSTQQKYDLYILKFDLIIKKLINNFQNQSILLFFHLLYVKINQIFQGHSLFILI